MCSICGSETHVSPLRVALNNVINITPHAAGLSMAVDLQFFSESEIARITEGLPRPCAMYTLHVQPKTLNMRISEFRGAFHQSEEGLSGPTSFQNGKRIVCVMPRQRRNHRL